MWWLIFAQAARVGVVWTTSMVFRKIFRTAAILFVGGYLIERVKEREERLKQYNEPNLGNGPDQESGRITS